MPEMPEFANKGIDFLPSKKLGYRPKVWNWSLAFSLTLTFNKPL